MFYHSQTNQYIREGQSFEINGTSYPANWLNCTTPEEKSALGLVEVVTIGSREDDIFYWVSESLNEGTLTYTNIPKDLVQLKNNWQQQIRQTAHSILVTTDYMDSRKANDSSYNPPSTWIEWRAAIRSNASQAIAAINSANNISELKTATQVQWALNPDQINVRIITANTATANTANT